MNYYPFHIGDYRSATMHLSNAEDLAYRRVLDWYYDTEQPLPLDTQWMARRLRVEARDLDTVLQDFFVRTGEGWVHERCGQEIAQFQQMLAKNRANGAKGGRPRKAVETDPQPVGWRPVGAGVAAATQPQGNQEPRTRNQEPGTRTPPGPRRGGWGHTAPDACCGPAPSCPSCPCGPSERTCRPGRSARTACAATPYGRQQPPAGRHGVPADEAPGGGGWSTRAMPSSTPC